MSDAGEPSGSRRFIRWFAVGRVQGVGFRYHVQRAALQLGLRGDVRNTSDGRVEIRAEGSDAQLDALMRTVRLGPARARVDRVETVESGRADPERHLGRFRIRH